MPDCLLPTATSASARRLAHRLSHLWQKYDSFKKNCGFVPHLAVGSLPHLSIFGKVATFAL
jgi:hypothetical protein